MKTQIYLRNECHKTEGLCIVIDVLRAFTTAAFAFAAGAEDITLVSSLEEAFMKHQQNPDLLLIGELEGRPIKGFHYSNSPAEIQQASLHGKRLVQRTSAGTQGVVCCSHAPQLLIASFVVAEATLRRIQAINPSHVSFIVTGTQNGDEDLALAEYLQKRLLGAKVPLDPFLERVRQSPEGLTFADPSIPEFGEEDLKLAMQADRFAFAMEVFNVEGALIAKKVLP